MKKQIKVAVIGGTGKSGKYVVQQLLAAGFHLRLLLRHPENFKTANPLLEIVGGDARVYESVHTLIEDCDAVVSTLGQPKGEPSVFSAATGNVLRAMQVHGVKRYIVTTGLNVDAPNDKKSTAVIAATEWMKKTYAETTTDKQVEYALLSASNVHWTMVRLPLIALSDRRGKVVVSLEDCPGEKISATDLAYFIVEQLRDEAYIQKAPFIASA